MFFQIWLTMQAIGAIVSPFVVRYALDIIGDDFTSFLKTTKNLPFAHSYDYCGPDHPDGWFDFDEIYNYYDENIRQNIHKILNLYRFLGIIKRKCYHNHDIYRVR